MLYWHQQFGVKQMDEARATGAQIVVNELPYNILSRAIEKDIVPYCIKHGIGIIASMALQQGLLAGIIIHPMMYRHIRPIPGILSMNGCRHVQTWRRRSGRRSFQTVRALQEIAHDLGVHIAQLSIAWILAKPNPVCISGFRNIKELESNVKAGMLELDNEIIGRIDRISEPILMKLGYNPDYYESPENSRIE